MKTNRIVRDKALDFLKIIITIIIVFHHFQQVTGVKYDGINFYNGKFYFGYLVELFFIISGYFTFKYIKKIEDKYSFKEFIFNKAKRLLPLVCISVIVFQILVYFYQNLYNQPWPNTQISVWGTIIASLGIQDGWVFTNPQLNNPIWYISVLMLCYVVFYVITYICNKKKIPYEYLYIAMILIGIGIQTYSISLPFFNYSSSRGYYSFFTGILLANYLNKKTPNMKTYIYCFLIIVFISIIGVFKYEYIKNGLNYILTFILFPCLIIILKLPILNKIFNFKIFEILSKSSYNVYIWHVPLLVFMYIFIKICNVSINFSPIIMIIFTVICEIFGLISYYLIEKPINKSIDKKVINNF